MNEFDFGTELDVRDDLSEIQQQQQQFKVADDDAFWYGSGGAEQSPKVATKPQQSKLP